MENEITAKEYREFIRTGKLPDRIADTYAVLESAFSHESLGAQKVPRFNTPVRLVCHHVRKRLLDPDNLSVKAFIDGIVKAGILADDTAKQIKSITHTQEKGKEEKTVITIYRENQ